VQEHYLQEADIQKKILKDYKKKEVANMTTVTITQAYCTICELVQQAITGISNTCVRIGYARAAFELSRQGLHEEAKYLILEKKKL
jgi:hypothetical protein